MVSSSPLPPQERLHQTIEGLYAAFASYPLSSLEGCPCCVSAGNKAQVTCRPLRELTEDDMGRYAGKAMTTWGTVDDFKHFLPRLFELTAAFRPPYEEFVVFGKLDYGRWRTWPTAEIEAIEQYFLALWDVLLGSGSQAWQFRDYFVAVAGVYPRFDELLQRWEARTDPTAWALLGEEVYGNSSVIFTGRYFNGPFLASVPLSEQFRAWVLSSTVQGKLCETFSRCTDEATAEKLGVAYDVIDYERKYGR